MRGADASSDHHLLVGKLQLKLKRSDRYMASRVKYNINSLKDPFIAQQFSITTRNKYQALQDMQDPGDPIDKSWDSLKKVWTEASEEILGRKKQHSKAWISKDTISKVILKRSKKENLNRARTRLQKERAHAEYTEANKDVKKSVRKDKRKFIDDLAKEAEAAARQHNMTTLYDATKQLSRKFKATNHQIRNLNGRLLTTTEEQLKRWVEHFQQLLNRPPPMEPPILPPANQELDISCEPPTRAEVEKAIKSLKNNKSAGPDNIPAEVLKADISTSVNMLHGLLIKIWDQEYIPSEWREGILVKLAKKGDLSLCKNYRGIMFLSTAGKVLNRIILERMREAVDRILRENQSGFRLSRSTADQITTLRIIVEQSLEWRTALCINFIDYEKAFDSLDRNVLWDLMANYGIPSKIISLVKNTYEGTNCRILHEGGLTESFSIKSDVRQGCLLSPFLFLLAVDWIMKETTTGSRNGIQWTLVYQLEDLDFADDLALLAHTHTQMQAKTTKLEAISSKLGLKINTDKTKTISSNASEQIMINNLGIEDVTSRT